MALLKLLICFFLQLPFIYSASVRINSLESVPDLERSMYKVVDGSACVRLLNLSGEIGCTNPGREKVVAPLVRYGDAGAINQLSAVLISLDEVGSFFKRLSTDLDLARNVGGLLVKTNTIQDELKGFSPDEKFPQSEFSPYENRSYEWNPNGSGIMWSSYNFPVFLVSENDGLILDEIAAKNKKNGRTYSREVAEFDLVMQTTKSGTHDSESCLKAGTCLPLGGYSVWSSLPPINNSSPNLSKPIILAMTSMDSAAFFRDKSFGAESSLSGLVALLAAVDALSRSDNFKSFKKQLVFVVVTGEAWGYLGSQRFLHELDLKSEAVEGLNTSLIETVLEIGSVGKAFNGTVSTFFAHSAGGPSLTKDTFSALQHAQSSLKLDRIQISAANPSNPGIPPSSLMSFQKKNPKISGIVLEDFDDKFVNKFYHSHLDDSSNINITSIVAAASVVARSLYILASDMKTSFDTDLDPINVNTTLVEELLGCLVKCDPGLSCGLVKKYISPSASCPSNYVGVLVTDPSSPPYPGYSSDISRFIWNFLADKTAIQRKPASNCKEGCNSQGELCIKVETDQGVCVRSSTRYIPAYSTRLLYDSGSWKLLPSNSSDSTSMADPVWTESNWDMIRLRVYTMHDVSYDRLILLAGVGITGFSYFAIEITKTIVAKALKRD